MSHSKNIFSTFTQNSSFTGLPVYNLIILLGRAKSMSNLIPLQPTPFPRSSIYLFNEQTVRLPGNMSLWFCLIWYIPRDY